MIRQYKKHFIIYNNGGVISATTPKDWARANYDKFPDYSFENSDTTPTVETIENYLINNCGFSKVYDEKIVVCYSYKTI